MGEKRGKLVVITKQDWILLKRAFKYLKPHLLLFSATFISVVMSMVLELWQPLIYGKIIDHILKGDLQKVWYALLTILLLMLGNGGISLLETYWSDLLANKIILDIKEELYHRILNLPVKIYDQLMVGEIISRVEGDVGTLSNILAFQSMRVVIDVVRVIGIGFLIFKISHILSWIVIIIFPLNYFIMGIFGRILRSKNREMRKLNDNYYSFLTESISGVREIKALNLEDKVQQKFLNWAKKIFHQRINIDVIGAFSGLCNMWINGFSGLIVMGVGSYLIISGYLSMGNYVAFNNYQHQFGSSLRGIAQLNSSIQQAMVSLERIFALIDNFMLPPENKEGFIPDKITGEIKFEKVYFKYDNEKNILKNITFSIPANQMTAIVGSSGSGKTTLFSLLIRFYEVEKGEIFLDGYPLNKLHLNFVRDQISIVSQEPYLFNMSIKENLLLGKPDATTEEIIEAAKKAHIHHFITSLPQGYDTIIGERGTRLSGGQKQRLAIARALLRGTRILLFDEATSALDGESEEYVQKTLQGLISEHTIVVIAHRLSTIINAAQIVVLNEGEIAGIGTHEMLMKNCPIYQRLYRSQSKDFSLNLRKTLS